MANLKILIIHSNADDLPTVLDKVRKLNKKSGPFDHVIIFGAIEDKIDGIDFSGISSLILLSSSSETAIHQENVAILRRFGTYEVSGLSIGYLDLSDKEIEKDKESIVKNFSEHRGSLDLLISRHWSESLADRQNNTLGHEVIDKINIEKKPRYHFVYDDEKQFFEANPFLWQPNGPVTRFINIAAFNSGQKWAYAFNISTGEESTKIYEKPDNLMENPYVRNKRSLEANADDGSTKSKKAKTVLPTNCHFCFTNPNVEDHMFISISKSAYLTIAKGPLSVPKGEMPFSGHCLLIPIEHIPRVKSIDNNEQQISLTEELNSYEKSVATMNYKKFDMSTIVFEIHSGNSIHFHKQLIPVPKYLIMKFSQALDRQVYLNNEKFKNNGKFDFKLYKTKKEKEYQEIVSDSKNNYLQFTVYETSDAEPVIYLSLFDSNERIDLQFGRRVSAFLLRLPKRINWNSPICKQTQEQEEKEVAKFQKYYDEYDVSK